MKASLHMSGKDVADMAATSGAIGAYFSFLPEIAAGLAILWTLIRIFEWVRYRIFGVRDDTTQESFE